MYARIGRRTLLSFSADVHKDAGYTKMYKDDEKSELEFSTYL
jgi:hypothetical protein